MQHNTETKIWNATLYLRLSRDDGDKEESNSITGQRELLRDFIRTARSFGNTPSGSTTASRAPISSVRALRKCWRT